MSLTKSLHTVTAVTNVARYLLTHRAVRQEYGSDAFALAGKALAVLGYPVNTFDTKDETVQRCVHACARILAE